MSLDEEKVTAEKVIIVLNDGEISVNKQLFDHHQVLSNMGDLDGFKYKVELDMSDFMPILTHILGSYPIKQPDMFFATCQYLGEIDLPILLSKNSTLIQKWALSPLFLVQCEVENMVLEMYSLMDKGILEADARATVISLYFENPMHHKLHEKSGRRLMPAMKTTDLSTLLFVLTDDLMREPPRHIDTSYPIIEPGNQWWTPTVKTTYSIKGGLRRLLRKFDGFPFVSTYDTYNPGMCVIAGGSVLRAICEKEQNGFYLSDNDIFLITRSENEALHMIENIHEWIIRSFPQMFMTRSKHAITFTTTNGVFQIILRLYHDVFQLLSGFDLDPCCTAYDGERILTIGRGLECFKTNSFPLLSWKQSETMAWRCKKMRNRRFSITIPGLTIEEFDKELKNEVKKSRTILKKIIHGEGRRGSDYDESQHPDTGNSFEFTLRNIRMGMEVGYAKQIQVITSDLDVIFDTRSVRVDDAFTYVNRMPSSEPKLCFIKNMAHGQATGSFQPTSEDFFEGIKW